MVFPDERIAEVCKWTHDQASEALKRGRSGEPLALAEYLVYSAHLLLRRRGVAPIPALFQTRSLFSAIDIIPSVGL